mmetsp:Transcript_22125/g.33204  ORF Transcript_22125/g.33204 Transcript_22125/m.33204 type:complete len:100 (-) Transcript_22125:1489-1788(-)
MHAFNENLNVIRCIASVNAMDAPLHGQGRTGTRHAMKIITIPIIVTTKKITDRHLQRHRRNLRGDRRFIYACLHHLIKHTPYHRLVGDVTTACLQVQVP